MGEYDWLVGVSLSFFSSFFSCIGLICQKKAHTLNQNLPDDRKWPIKLGITCSPCWWASFLLMGLIPFPFDFFAFQFAAQSLVAPFAAVTLVFNQFLAPCILKEKLYTLDIIASMIVLVGCVLTTLSGSHEDERYTMQKMLDQYEDAFFIVSLSVVSGAMVLMIISIFMNERKSSDTIDDATTPEISPVLSPVLASKQTERSPPRNPSSLKRRASRSISFREAKQKVITTHEKVMPFYYAFVGGGLGALQNIFFKAVGTLLNSSAIDIQEDNEERPWSTVYPYLFIAICIILAISQLSFLNKGMARYKAVLVFPLYNACYLTLSCFMGAAYYGEFKNFNTWQWVAFPVGIVITLVGVVLFIFSPRELARSSQMKGDDLDDFVESPPVLELAQAGTSAGSSPQSKAGMSPRHISLAAITAFTTMAEAGDMRLQVEQLKRAMYDLQIENESLKSKIAQQAVATTLDDWK